MTLVLDFESRFLCDQSILWGGELCVSHFCKMLAKLDMKLTYRLYSIKFPKLQNLKNDGHNGSMSGLILEFPQKIRLP